MMETDKIPSFMGRLILLLALPIGLASLLWSSSHAHPPIWRILFRHAVCPVLLKQGIKVTPVTGNTASICQASLSMDWSGQIARLTAYHQGHRVQLLIPAREIVAAERK
ncbi:MAG: hypothetical protein KGI54_16550 [Pseudomonadota bacterium]|nr:hypothetical protein [Pseudomonadota bacterium]